MIRDDVAPQQKDLVRERLARAGHQLEFCATSLEHQRSATKLTPSHSCRVLVLCVGRATVVKKRHRPTGRKSGTSPSLRSSHCWSCKTATRKPAGLGNPSLDST